MMRVSATMSPLVQREDEGPPGEVDLLQAAARELGVEALGLARKRSIISGPEDALGKPG
jgi:hypothetical protein